MKYYIVFFYPETRSVFNSCDEFAGVYKLSTKINKNNTTPKLWEEVWDIIFNDDILLNTYVFDEIYLENWENREKILKEFKKYRNKHKLNMPEFKLTDKEFLKFLDPKNFGNLYCDIKASDDFKAWLIDYFGKYTDQYLSEPRGSWEFYIGTKNDILSEFLHWKNDEKNRDNYLDLVEELKSL